MIKVPNPIDRHVGSRVRMQRMLLGLSQERLGEALGVTFQQIQKYEKGSNRIGASRLQQISKILEVEPAYFFEGLQTPPGPAPNPPGFQDGGSPFGADFLSTAEGLALNRAFMRIKSAKLRRRVVDLVVAIAETPAYDAPVREHDGMLGCSDDP